MGKQILLRNQILTNALEEREHASESSQTRSKEPVKAPYHLIQCFWELHLET